MDKKIELADKWFKLHDIPTIVVDNKMYISNGHFEFELSTFEVNYRANCYLNINKQHTF